MTANVFGVPYLRTSRNFPEDLKQLTIEVNKSYVDTANNVNVRSIGIYPTVKPTVNGDAWYFNGFKHQGFRQIYLFTSAGNIPHGITWEDVQAISPNSYGSYTDGTNWYGVIFATSNIVAAQVSFYVTPTDIVILSGVAPAISSGIIVLEWLSKV